MQPQTSEEILQVSLALVGTLDNASGQICQMREGKPYLLLFELGCAACSEVAGKNADEFGEALATIVSAVPAIITERDQARADLVRYQEIVTAALDSIQDELHDGAVFENVMLATAARIALAWIDARRG